jgi:galactokinase
MEPVAARRAAHVIGENERVLAGRRLLNEGRLEEFGGLMFESHRSSRVNFENSARELDFLVDTAAKVPGVLGARLSGGGFGGSVVALVHPRDVAVIRHALTAAYRKEFDHPCDVRVLTPSAGARVL